MSPKQAMWSFENRFIDDYEEGDLGDKFGQSEREVMREILRSSMASLLIWVAEQMPPIKDEGKFLSDKALAGYLRGLRECRSIILDKAKELE